MADKVTVYEKPTCTTCRNMNKLLTDMGVDFDKVNYHVEPLSESKIRQLLKKMGISARELLRSKEQVYKDLNLGETNKSDDELISLMAEHPQLIERPIVEKGDKAVLGRPIEKVSSLF